MLAVARYVHKKMKLPMPGMSHNGEEWHKASHAMRCHAMPFSVLS